MIMSEIKRSKISKAVFSGEMVRKKPHYMWSPDSGLVSATQCCSEQLSHEHTLAFEFVSDETEDFCTCFTCGYKWRSGQNGDHSCSEKLRETVLTQNVEILVYAARLQNLEAAVKLLIERIQSCDGTAQVEIAGTN